jgi:hypothetical protein
LERKRIDYYKSFLCDCINIETEVLPRIKQCYKEIEISAELIDSNKDTEVVIKMFKTGYTIPTDHVFENLSEKSFILSKQEINLNKNLHQNNILTNKLNTIKNSTFGGHSSSNLLNNSNTINTNHHGFHTSGTSRQKKYRTLNKIKGLFLASVKSENDSMFELPPQQLKNELIKKISSIEIDLEKQQKEREGLLKLKEIYTKNHKFGDSQSAEQALLLNEDKLNNLKTQIKKYQEIYNQVELTINDNQHQNLFQKQNSQQNQYSSGEFSSSSGGGGGSVSSNGSTLMRDANLGACKSEDKNCNLSYQIPACNSQNTVNSNIYYSSNTNAVAYAISPLSHLTNNLKKAPLVNKNNNESFDAEEVEDEDNDGDCYERPNSNFRKENNISKLKIAELPKILPANNVDYEKYNNSDIYEDSQNKYDQVESNVYEQTLIENNQYEEHELVIGTALVMYSYEGTVQNAMSIEENESLNVLEKDSGDGWTLVKKLNGEKGYVPTDYIRIVYY